MRMGRALFSLASLAAGSRATVRRVVAASPEIDAVALRRLGIGVPDDIGIVGFDGIPFAAISNPRLTTVAVPSEEIGRQSAALLIRAVIEGRMPDGVLLPVEFVVRESTRPGPGSPPARSDG